ncbi:MAG: polysaccharide biosynthesis tyrosine autokinase [Xenococcaceae cyanobacterium MO_188.B19]|nr:polysaccharide biosynthesis tyrosine autokinase [Xenococcaceae cyanobacterium MO_188.B19]
MKVLQPSVREHHYWQIIKRHQVLGGTVLLVVSLLGIIITALAEPVYEAEVKLKFKSNIFDSDLINDDNNQLIESLGILFNQDIFINTEIEEIKNYHLIEKTIDDLEQKNTTSHFLFNKEKFLDNLTLEKVKHTNVLVVKYRDTKPIKAQEAVNQLVRNYIATNQEKVGQTRLLLEEQLPQFEQKLQETETAIRQIQEETQIFAPQEEAMIIATNMEVVQQKIAKLQGQIASVNAKSAYIRSKLGMNAEQAIAATTVVQSPDIQQAVRQLQQLESQLNQQTTRFPENNPIITNLEEKIARQKQLIQQKIQNIATSQGLNLNQARDFGSIQQELTAELIKLEASHLGLQQEITYLLGLEKAQREKANLLPQALQKLKQLQRQLAFFQADYQALLQQIRNVQGTKNPLLNNVQVIAYAEVPIKPIRYEYIDYLISIGVGLLAATVIIVLAEITDTSVNTIEKATKLFGYTWLGIIPDTIKSMPTEALSKLQLTPRTFQDSFYSHPASSIDLEQLEVDSPLPKVVVKDYPGASESESYRMLQSNIKFLATYKEVKVIVVTSSVSQEGKSTIAANLACAMAQARHKVLLIDGNLHYPIQHRIWNTTSMSSQDSEENCFGLSNIIEGQIDTNQGIQKVFPKLDLVSSGTIPSSPASLLDSSRMKDVMDHWRKIYDFIIVDTPALDLAADAPILGRIADGVLLVVNPDSLNYSKVNFAKEILLRSGQNVLGIVFNKIDPKLEPKNYFYHALEERLQEASKPKVIKPSREELWLSVSQMSQESKRPKMMLTPEEIISIPKDQLQDIVNYLQEDLEELTQLVKEQEEELFMQSQMVKKLQKRVNLSRDIDRSFLGQQLTQEQERKNMLNATLVGQRRNLERKQRMLRQYRQALTVKQSKLNNH